MSRHYFIDAKRTIPRFYIVIFSVVLIFSVVMGSSILVDSFVPTTGDLNNRIKIAVDAGHGGYDPGVRLPDVEEKEINLAIALKLKEVLTLNGFDVLLTRDEDEDFLETAGPKKQQDMRARKELIEQSGAHYLISIHANSIASSRWKGAQVFHQPGREQSENLANIIQAHLKNDTGTSREAKSTDFFLTREIEIIGVVVECGFLSNPEDRANLQNEEYQYKLAWSMTKGLIEFLDTDRSRPPM